jgi:hypothetical protein
MQLPAYLLNQSLLRILHQYFCIIIQTSARVIAYAYLHTFIHPGREAPRRSPSIHFFRWMDWMVGLVRLVSECEVIMVIARTLVYVMGGL